MTESAPFVDAGGTSIATRQALPGDAAEIWGLLDKNARLGLLLPRTLDEIYAAISQFAVAESAGEVLGCVSLHFYSEKLVEIRSLAVRTDRQSHGTGRSLVEWGVARAMELKIARVFALTFQTGFFEKIGFRWYDKKDLPEKIWQDCIGCAQFPVCSEEAFVFDLPVGSLSHQ